MPTLNHRILMEICLGLIEEGKELQRFILVGKESFFSYIQIFQSIRRCEISEYYPLLAWVSMVFYEYITMNLVLRM